MIRPCWDKPSPSPPYPALNRGQLTGLQPRALSREAPKKAGSPSTHLYSHSAQPHKSFLTPKPPSPHPSALDSPNCQGHNWRQLGSEFLPTKRAGGRGSRAGTLQEQWHSSPSVLAKRMRSFPCPIFQFPHTKYSNRTWGVGESC